MIAIVVNDMISIVERITIMVVHSNDDSDNSNNSSRHSNNNNDIPTYAIWIL